MNVLINGIEFAKTGTHGCRWVATHWMDESYMSMMTDSACDQIAEFRAEVERIAAEVERRERIIDAERNMQAKLVAEGARLSAENARLRAVRDVAAEYVTMTVEYDGSDAWAACNDKLKAALRAAGGA